MTSGTASADAVLSDTLAGLPLTEHGYLVPSGAPVSASLANMADRHWLDTQIGLQAQRWPSVDRQVLATLWWYSVSQVLLTPTLSSWFVTGRVLSPAPADVELHCLADGRIFTARSTAVLAGEDLMATASASVRDTLERAIKAIAAAGATREPPLWAIATDSLANRLLWVGRACGDVDRATELAAALIAAIGPPMPAPRFVDIEPRPPRTGRARFVRRASCCLIYLEPGEGKCVSCPRLTPARRRAMLTAAADFV